MTKWSHGDGWTVLQYSTVQMVMKGKELQYFGQKRTSRDD